MAAKRRSSLLILIASTLVVFAPAVASSHSALHPKTRVELKTPPGPNRVERLAVSLETASRYYDPFGEVASGSSVAPKSVGTPYGTAVQDTSAAALRLRSEVAAGRPIFRGGNFPKSAGSDAQFFSPENPLSPGFADRVGAGNLGSKTPDFIMGGRVRPGGNFITRPAPGLGANKGGALEIVNEPGAVQFDFFVMPD